MVSCERDKAPNLVPAPSYAAQHMVLIMNQMGAIENST